MLRLFELIDFRLYLTKTSFKFENWVIVDKIRRFLVYKCYTHMLFLYACNFILLVRLKIQAFIYTFVGMETNDHESINLHYISSRKEPPIIVMFGSTSFDAIFILIWIV